MLRQAHRTRNGLGGQDDALKESHGGPSVGTDVESDGNDLQPMHNGSANLWFVLTKTIRQTVPKLATNLLPTIDPENKTDYQREHQQHCVLV